MSERDRHAEWLRSVKSHGAQAVESAHAKLAADPSVLDGDINPLATVGKLLSAAYRRSVLLSYIRFYRGDLAAVARELRLGSNSSPALRLVRELGLEGDLAAIRRESKAPPSGHPLDT